MSNDRAQSKGGKMKQLCVGLEQEVREKIKRIQQRIALNEGPVSEATVVRRLLKTHPDVRNA